MLSILIPVFNFDVRELVRKLHSQAISCNIDFEIILIDDHSRADFLLINRDVRSLEKVTLTELDENIGRSAIRNQLASSAKYPYLLFLDCDSEIEQDDFILNYISTIKPNHVITGGRSYKKDAPQDKKLYLRWFYGVNREVSTAEKRKKQRYKSFMTNNFLIPAEVFNKIRFNESLSGYGHEDTLFGTELKKRHIDIDHIDNPLCHVGLETADEFISKTQQGIKNLAYLVKLKLVDDDVKLVSTYHTLKKLHLVSTFLRMFRMMESSLHKNLLSTHPYLGRFDIYKLGLLARELRESN